MTTRKTASPAQLAARAAFAARAKAGTLKKGAKLKPARKTTAKAASSPAKARKRNPLAKSTKTTERRSLVGSTQYAVLFYAGKAKPTGKPDLVIPARDKAHADSFVAQLEAKGASGCVVIEKTVNRV